MLLEEKSTSTLHYNIHVMKFVIDHIPTDLDKLVIADIDKLRSELINWRRGDGQKVSDVTKKQYKINIKRFLYWYAKENRDNLSIYDLYMRLAERVNLGDTKRKKENEPENKPVEHVFTQVEIDNMIEEADTTRDKAILTVLAESGCRLGEITGCRIKDFKMLKKGCELKLPKGKTGPRIVPLLESAGRIDSWLRVHPLRNDPDAALWVKEHGNHEAIKGPTIYAIVKRVAKKAGIKRRAHPHMFRHTRATDLARENTNPEAMKQFLGWEKNSAMPSLYTHLSQDDLKTIIFRPYGIGPVEVKETKDGKFGNCPNCAKMVRVSESFCWNCGTTLDEDAKKGRVPKLLNRNSKRQLFPF